MRPVLEPCWHNNFAYSKSAVVGRLQGVISYSKWRPDTIITTTNNVDGHPVAEYLQIVSGETVIGINAFKDIGAGIRNIVGGRSKSYESATASARDEAIQEMAQRAAEIGAHGVIGVDMSYQTFGQGDMILVAATGTAVRFAS